MQKLALMAASLTLMTAVQQQDRHVPADVRGFSGQLTGVVTAKHEDGTISFAVARVTRVWRGNEASNLEWFLGRTIRIGPRWAKDEQQRWRRLDLHVRFLEQVRVDQGLRLEIRHAEQDRFAILELSDDQRRSARGPSSTRLPAELRGFSGLVSGVARARNDDGTVRLDVREVLRVWQNSKAKRPEALAGTTIRVGPRWLRGQDGKWRPSPQHVAFLRRLQIGEDYRIEVQNAEADHFQILELSPEQRQGDRERR